MHRKRMLLWAIVRNFGRLLSYDFLMKSFFDRRHPTWLFIRMVVIQATIDIFLMVIRKDYPA